METVEVVVRLPKERYEEIKQAESKINNDCYKYDYWFKTAMMIANGIVLPKGHGRLIDADELEELFGEKCVGDCGACMTKRKTDGRGRWYDTCSLIDTAPTIIEADKEA